MTPKEALALLDEMAQDAKLTRAEHKRVQEAVRILDAIIVDNEKRMETRS